MNAKELLNALDAFEKEKGIAKEVVIQALKDALEKAYKRNTDADALCRVEINSELGTIEMYGVKNVVMEVEDDVYQIELEDALKINPLVKVGDVIEYPVDPDDLNRMAAMQAKQVLTQKIREFEKQSVYEAFIDKKDDIISGVVERIEPEFILINLGKTNAIMRLKHMLPGETFKIGQPIRVYVVDVDKSAQGAAVIVSRSEPGFLKRLFESEIHEVYDGTVEIKHIARQAGERAKVSVFSRNKDVDPAGACIGQKGLRIQKISNQILGEKIDVIEYFDEPSLYVAEALKPAGVLGVNIDSENNAALAIVKDDDLSLAIGKKGVNARLAVKLTGYKIDIKTQSTALEEGIEYRNIDDVRFEYNALKRAHELKEESKASEIKVETVKSEKEENETVNPVKIVETPAVEVVVPAQEVRIEKTYTPSAPKDTRVPSFVKKPYGENKKPFGDAKKPFTDNKKPFKKDERTPKRDDDRDNKHNVIKPEDLEAIKKKHEEARSYMPVYTKNELEELEDENVNHEDNFYENVDYDEFDDYYEEK